MRTQDEATASRQRRPWRRRAAIAGAATLAAILVLLALVHTGPARRYVLDRVTALLADQGIQVQADDLDFNLLALSVDLRNVAVRSEATPDAPFATIGSLNANLSLLDMIRGSYVVESARIDDLNVHYLVFDDGSDNLPRPPSDPDSPGEPLDYLIADGRVVGATIRYENRGTNLDLLLPIRELVVEGDRATSRHDIRLDAGGGSVVSGDRRVPLDRLTGTVDLGEDDVTLEPVVLESEGSRVELTGALEHFAAPVLDAQLNAALDAGRAVTLAGLTEPAAGRVDVSARAAGPLDALEVTADVRGRDLAFGDLRDLALDLDVRYDTATGTAIADRLEARAPWGHVAGSATVETTGPGRSRVTLTADGIEAATLMRVFDVSPVAATRLDGNVDASWPGLQFDAATGTGRVQLRPTATRPSEGVLPMSGGIVIDATPQRVVAHVASLETAGARIDAQVSLIDGQRLGGSVQAVVDDVVTTSGMIEALLGRPSGSLLPVDSSGAVTATASLGGTISAPTVIAQIDAPAVVIAGTEPLMLNGRVRYATDAVAIDAVDVVWHDARAHAAGRVGLTGERTVSGTFDASGFDVATVLAAAGQDPSMAAGTVSLTATASGTLDAPDVAATLAGRDLMVSTESLGTVNADVRLEGQLVTLTRLELDKPQRNGDGHLTATGTYRLDTRAYTSTVTSNALEITSLTLPDGRPLQGRVAVDGRGEGTVDQPAGELRISADALRLADHDLGNMVIDATVRDGAARVDVTADHFGLDANALIGMAQPYAATLDARITSLDLAALPVEAGAPLTGTVTATIEANGNLETPAEAEGRATIQTLSGTWNQQPFALTGPAGLGLADERVTIDSLRVTARDSTLTVDGMLPIATRVGTGAIHIDARANLATLADYAPVDAGVTANGTVTLTGTIEGNLERVDPRLQIAVNDATVLVDDWSEPVSGVALRAAVADGVASIDELTARWGEATLSALARMPLSFLPDLPIAVPPGSGRATVTATVADLEPGTLPAAPEEAGGHVGLRLEASADRPGLASASGLVTFSELDVAYGTLTLAQQQPSTVRIENGTATIDRFDLSGSAGSIRASGSIGLLGERPIDVRVAGDLEVAALSAFTDAARAEGRATLDVAARGTIDEPDLAGAVTLADATVVVDEPEIYAESLGARIELAGDRITLASLSGTLNGGTLSGSGGLSIVDGAPADVDVRIEATDVAFEAPLDLRSLSNTTLTITEQDDTILVAGRVAIQEAGLTGDLNFDTGLLATINSPASLDLTEERNPLLEQVRFDIEVVTETPVIIDNNLARAEVTTDLRVLGTPYETGLSGRLVVLEGGEVTLNERRYAVERGTITFLDERRIVPSMDLQLTTSAGRYDVTLGVTGEPGDTDTTLVSTPTLPEPDIMALLVTGRTLDEMRGEEYDVARENVMSYLAGRIGSSLGRDLERATGLSEVRLEPNLIAAEADPGARLTIGQELTQELELVFSTDLADSSDQIWVGRYDLTRRLDTSVTRQNDGSYRFDLRHDVRVGGRPAPERMPRSRPAIVSLRVEADGVLPDAEALDLLGLEVGDAYDYFAAHEGVRQIEDRLRERGHLESRVRLERTIDEGSADLVLRVRGGPLVSIVYEGDAPPNRVAEEVRRQWSRGVFDSQRAGDAIEALRVWSIDDRYLSPELEYRIAQDTDEARRIVFTIERGRRFDRLERVFEGPAGVEPDVLNDIIVEQNLERAVFIDPTVVTTLLERYYREEGFLVAEIDGPEFDFNGTVAQVVFTVREGPQFNVGIVTVDGTTAIAPEAIVADLPLVQGDPYLPRVVARSLDRIRDVYWDRAYNDVRSSYALTLDRDTGRVDVAFSVEEGPRSVVAEVQIAGNNEASQRLVREQFELEPGEALDLSLLGRSRRNLYDTGAFSIVDITRESTSPDNGDGQATDVDEQLVDVTVSVREVQPFRVRYGGSYDTEGGLGGVVDISNHNSLGKARVLGFSGRYDSQLHEGRVYFSQPSLLYFPVQTSASLYYREERNPETTLTEAFNVDRLGASLQQERQLGDSFVWTYGYRYERARKFAATPASLLDETVTVSPLTSTFLRETRDEILDASSGSFTSHALSYSPTWLGADTSYLRYYGQYFRYLPLERPTRKRFTNEILRPRFVYAVGARLGLAWSPTAVPETERFYAGGSTTLRGFEQNAVGPVGADGIPTGGQALVVVNNEVRIPLVGFVDGVGFLDIGAVSNRIGDFSFSDLRETAGIGIRVRTPWFLIRGDYGIILDLRAGERRGRFYFSIGQAF